MTLTNWMTASVLCVGWKFKENVLLTSIISIKNDDSQKRWFPIDSTLYNVLCITLNLCQIVSLHQNCQQQRWSTECMSSRGTTIAVNKCMASDWHPQIKIIRETSNTGLHSSVGRVLMRQSWGFWFNPCSSQAFFVLSIRAGYRAGYRAGGTSKLFDGT